MQELVLTGPGELTWKERPAPTIEEPGQALVRPVAVSTCDFDHLMVKGEMPMPMPVAIGHECVAEVVEVGAAVRKLRAGDLVVVPFQVACGECGACRRGHTSNCERTSWLSGYGMGPLGGDFGGAMADLMLVPYAEAMLVPLPEGVAPAEAAAAGCNVVDAYRCVGPQLAERPGAGVLVVGGAFESIALYAVAIAKALGAGRVDYVDRDPRRRERAAALGAEPLDRLRVQPGAYPISVDASLDPELLELAVRATAPDGVCTVSPMYTGSATPLPLFDMFQRCVTLRTGQPHVRAHLETVLELIAAGLLRHPELAPPTVAWEEGASAFGGGEGKTVCLRDCHRRSH